MGFKRTDSGRVVLEVLPKSLEEGAGVSWGGRRGGRLPWEGARAAPPSAGGLRRATSQS